MAAISISGWPSASGRTFTLTVTESSYDSIENTSLVAWTLSISGGNNQSMDTYVKCVVNGTTVYNASSPATSDGGYTWNGFPANTGSTSGTITVSHAADGTKTISFYIEGYAVNYTTYSNTGSLALTNINRTAPTVTASIGTIDVNSIQVTATSGNYASKFGIRKKTTGDWGAWTYWTPSNDTTTSHTFSVTGLTANTSYTFQVAAQRGLNGIWGYSSNTTAKTLGSSTITSAGNVTLGNACSVKWTPLDSTFKFKLKFSLGNFSATVPASGYITPNSTSAYTYTGYTIPLADVANELPNATTGTMSVTLTTYTSGGTQIGSSSSATFTVTVPSSVKPTISSVTLQEGTASGFGVYTKSLSTVKATVSAAGAYNSTITSIVVKVGDKSYTANSSGVATSAKLWTYGSMTVLTTVTDTRGRTATNSQNITVYNYYKPTIGIDITVTGTTVAVKVSGSVASVNSQNTKQLVITEKKLSTNTQTGTTTVTNSNLNYSYSYTWTRSIPDIGTESYEYTATITDRKQSVTLKKQTAVICISRLGGGRGVTFFGEAKDPGIWIVDGTTYHELDYIVDQGTSGIWTYRKWNSGVSECWGQVNVNVTSWSQFGNAYEGLPGAGVQSYPTSLFNAAPTLNYSITRNDGAPAIISIEASTGASSSQTPNLYPIRPSSSSTTGNNLYVMQYYAIGRWKS